MTTVQQDQMARSVVTSAPETSATIATAGETGKEWYDVHGLGSISSEIMDITINNTDRYQPGKILMAMRCSPSIIPVTNEGITKPPTVAARICSMFQQMVFSNIFYEFICSKGSLTNAKLIASFIPQMDYDRLLEMTDFERKALLDRQANKVIFSPSPNQVNVLNAEYAYLTSIVSTGESMGVVCLAIYQSVVANIAGDGSNDIHLTCRMSTAGLKVRYPMTPGESAATDDDLDAIVQLEPQLPDQYVRSNETLDLLPKATTAETTTQSMLAIPSTFLAEIQPKRITNAQTVTGEVARMLTGPNDVFGLQGRTFRLFTDEPAYDASEYTHKIWYAEVDSQSRKWHFKIKLPFTMDENTIYNFDPSYFWSLTLTADDNSFWCMTAPSDLKIFTDPDDPTVILKEGEIEIQAIGFLRDDFHFGLNPDMPYYLDIVCRSITSRMGNLPEIVNIPNDTHAVLWSQQSAESNAEQIVKEAIEGFGFPLIANLTNQQGFTNQGRSPDELDAEIVVGNGVKRGDFLETLGDIAHTAGQFMPLLSAFVRNDQAIVVEATTQNPIHYVPIGGTKKINVFNSPKKVVKMSKLKINIPTYDVNVMTDAERAVYERGTIPRPARLQ